MGYYLIDFENVHDIGLNGVTSLTEKDELCIFYSAKSEHMSFETHVNIMKTKAKVKYIKLRKSARNYLDFQLVTHLGYLIGKNAPGPYYIISKDTGYESAIDYWRDHGVNIIRQPSISYSSRQGRFPGQQSGQITPAAIVTIQESHQVVQENAPATLDVIPENTAIEAVPVREPEEIREISPEELHKIFDGDQTELPDEAEAPAQTDIAEEPFGSDDHSEDYADTPDQSSVSDQADIPDQTEDDKDSAEKEAAPKTPEQSGLSVTEQEMPSSSAESDEPVKVRKNQKKKNSQKKQSGSRGKKTAPETAPADEKAQPDQAVAPEPVSSDASDTPKAPDAAPAAEAEAAVPSRSLEYKPELDAAKTESLPENFRKKVRTALKGKEIPSAYYSSIYKAILHSYDKLALNNLMVKSFGSSKGGVVYNQIKDIFTEYHQQGQ